MFLLIRARATGCARAGVGLAPLAKATIHALATGGRPAGERALRLWLHAYLAPHLGQEQPDARRRSARIEVTIRHAQALANGERLHAAAPVATAQTEYADGDAYEKGLLYKGHY